MNVDLAEELLNELGSSLEDLETQHAALFQFLKDNGIFTDEQIAPYLEQAGKASSVRWRAARIRLEALIRTERQREEELGEDASRRTGEGEALPSQDQEEEAKASNDAGRGEASQQGEEAETAGGVDGGGKRAVTNSEEEQKRPAAKKEQAA